MWENRIDINNKNELIEKLNFLKINLAVIGPEIPLANGFADFLPKKALKYLAWERWSKIGI